MPLRANAGARVCPCVHDCCKQTRKEGRACPKEVRQGAGVLNAKNPNTTALLPAAAYNYLLLRITTPDYAMLMARCIAVTATLTDCNTHA